MNDQGTGGAAGAGADTPQVSPTQHAAWSFRCSACGRCCNSAPAMSIPELFHHQHDFVGCLGLRRVHRLHPGAKLGSHGAEHTATVDDAAAFAELDTELLHSHGSSEQERTVLLTLGFDDASGRCPVLTGDGKCAIHEDRKPAGCRAVPLDPLVPLRLQHLVLAERWRESLQSGSRCVRRDAAPGYLSLVKGCSVLDDPVRAALEERRRELAHDKQLWGSALFRQLAPELNRGAGARVPEYGYWVISIVPVLVVLAGYSPACRERCIEYLDAQLALISRLVRRQQSPGTDRGLDAARRLTRLARTASTLRSTLRRPALQPASAAITCSPVAEAEVWLGINPGQSEPGEVAQTSRSS